MISGRVLTLFLSALAVLLATGTSDARHVAPHRHGAPHRHALDQSKEDRLLGYEMKIMMQFTRFAQFIALENFDELEKLYTDDIVFIRRAGSRNTEIRGRKNMRQFLLAMGKTLHGAPFYSQTVNLTHISETEIHTSGHYYFRFGLDSEAYSLGDSQQIWRKQRDHDWHCSREDVDIRRLFFYPDDIPHTSSSQERVLPAQMKKQDCERVQFMAQGLYDKCKMEHKDDDEN